MVLEDGSQENFGFASLPKNFKNLKKKQLKKLFRLYWYFSRYWNNPIVLLLLQCEKLQQNI